MVKSHYWKIKLGIELRCNYTLCSFCAIAVSDDIYVSFSCSDGFFFAVKEVSLLDQGSLGKQSIYQLEQVRQANLCAAVIVSFSMVPYLVNEGTNCMRLQRIF